MRISVRWLSEYVTLPPELAADGAALAARLTAVGLEVEAVERLGGLAGVVAGRILESGPHPNADKLSVTKVDAGGAPLQIVCGAKNYQVGDVVPVATVGTELPGGQKITQAKLRGVDSSGMLCSARELGLSADASGLYILDPKIPPGTPVSRALDLEDVVLEVNVTPNRPDCLSHLGIAREVAAFLGTALRAPQPKLAEEGPPAKDLVKVRIEAPERCARYAARVIEGVKIGPSPRWLARRLEACGVRSISNVVDATNFVLLELGHPLHAFDLAKVEGGEIVVRTAASDEKMTTLDGKERALSPEDLVIADVRRPSALAGVMGGSTSEVSEGTTRVLLESAWFTPATVRRTAARHGLHTEASHRFERGADPEMVLLALDRCAALIAELAGGKVRPGQVDVHPRPRRPVEVELHWSFPARFIGIPGLGKETARAMLTPLGFGLARDGGESGTFTVPSWRPDVSRPEDLVEEILRCHGFDKVPEAIPRVAVELPVVPREAETVERLRAAMSACGFDEVVNFSFVAPRELEAVGEKPGSALRLRNPISAEMAVMRTSQLPSVLKNAGTNLRQGRPDLRLYELGRVYLPSPASGRLPIAEPQRLTAVLLGRRSPLGWAAGGEAVDFYDAKGAVEGALASVGLAAPLVAAGDRFPFLHPRSAATVVVPASAAGSGSTELGWLGELHPAVAAAFELPRGTFALELDVDALIAAARLVAAYHSVPRLPAVLRDLAVVVAEEVTAARVTALAREGGGGLVEDVTLFDVYRGAPIPPGKKNLALAIRYRAADRTLTDDEVTRLHEAIVKRLASELGAELRG